MGGDARRILQRTDSSSSSGIRRRAKVQRRFVGAQALLLGCSASQLWETWTHAVETLASIVEVVVPQIQIAYTRSSKRPCYPKISASYQISLAFSANRAAPPLRIHLIN